MAARNGQNLLAEALRVAQAATRSHPARLACLLRLACDACGLTSATLYLPDPDHTALTQRYSTLDPGGARSCLIPMGTGCAGRAALCLAPASSPRELLHQDEPSSDDCGDFLSLPVIEGRRLHYVLSLATAPGAPQPGLARALRPLLPVFSSVLNGLVAAQGAERSRRNLALVTAFAHLLNSPITSNLLVPRFLRLVTGSGLACCAVVRLTGGERGKQRVFRSCRREARPSLPLILAAEHPLTSQVLGSEAPCNESPHAIGVDYYALGVPLDCSGKLLGTLSLFAGPDLVSPEQSEFVETLARLFSSALAESLSSERISAFLQENDKKLKELSLLYRMSNTMLSTIKLNKLIHLTLTALTSGATPFYDRAMLFLTNERSGVLQGMLGVTSENAPTLAVPKGAGTDLLSSRWDISEEAMASQRNSDFCRLVQGKRLELDATQNIASQAVLEKRLIYVPREAEESGDDLRPGHASAYAASPLIAHGKAVGAVLVDNALTGAPITQEDLRFLQLFTNQAGMAIENSILYNRVEDTNRQLSEAQESLLQKERLAAIGEMAAGIAHELKGPLVSIGGFAGRLTRRLPHGSSEWEHADLIVREVLRLEAILSEILFFSKRATICYTPCDLAQIVKDCLAVVRPPIEEKEITVVTRFSRRKLMLLGDSQQLKQVFINIILNAVDAMGPGGRLTLQTQADDLDGKEAVCVRVVDTGGGIPVEALSSIFTPFYTTKENGTGLGLPIANRIITNHGGKIQIINKPGAGAEFRVVLPKHL
jgi:two-component system, NtrC family, sensor histidine kinase HydH